MDKNEKFQYLKDRFISDNDLKTRVIGAYEWLIEEGAINPYSYEIYDIIDGENINVIYEFFSDEPLFAEEKAAEYLGGYSLTLENKIDTILNDLGYPYRQYNFENIDDKYYPLSILFYSLL